MGTERLSDLPKVTQLVSHGAHSPPMQFGSRACATSFHSYHFVPFIRGSTAFCPWVSIIHMIAVTCLLLFFTLHMCTGFTVLKVSPSIVTLNSSRDVKGGGRDKDDFVS